jgi:host factor-I protein
VDAKSSPQNIQDAFLNTARRERDTVTIYLMNGAKLSGRIKSFDKFSVLLESGAQEQLIFKHAISTILHARRSNAEMRAPHSSEQAPHPGPGGGSGGGATNAHDTHRRSDG